MRSGLHAHRQRKMIGDTDPFIWLCRAHAAIRRTFQRQVSYIKMIDVTRVQLVQRIKLVIERFLPLLRFLGIIGLQIRIVGK